MSRSLFRTPVLQPLLAWIAVGLLRLTGWRVVGGLPPNDRYVLIGAPHTSNWDFPLMLLAVLKVGMDVHWLGKKSLFPFPFAGFMRWLGGIPVDRSKSNRLVDQLVPPEGTRSQVERWKSGFYYVAQGAGVPILLGFIDFSRKELGFGPLFHPTGDYAADLASIQDFYRDKRGIRR
jgi:1-acyl-sn-glycerol-3-phosphate acyltransferase